MEKRSKRFARPLWEGNNVSVIGGKKKKKSVIWTDYKISCNLLEIRNASVLIKKRSRFQKSVSNRWQNRGVKITARRALGDSAIFFGKRAPISDARSIGSRKPVDKTRRDRFVAARTGCSKIRDEILVFSFFCFRNIRLHLEKRNNDNKWRSKSQFNPAIPCIVILGLGANFSPIILTGSFASTDPSTPPVSRFTPILYIFTRYGRGPRRKFPEFQLTRARVSRNLSGGIVKQSRALARLSVEFLFRHAFFEREKKRKKGEEEEREEERKKKKDRCFTR